MINILLDRRDRSRFEKLGSGLGNFTGLLEKFGLNLAYLVAGRRGKSYIEAVFRLSRFCSSWKGGASALVKYLKTCQITLMQAVSKGPVSEARELGCVHARGLGRLPRLIPNAHRVSIMRGDVPTIRLWLSLLGVYRIIECPGKSSYQTITQPKRVAIDQPLAEFSSFLLWFKGNIPLAGRVLKRIPVPKLAFKPMAILTSGPNVPPEVGAMWAVAFDALAIWNARQTPWYKSLEDYCLRTMNTKFLGLIREMVGSIPTKGAITAYESMLEYCCKHNHKIGESLFERSLHILQIIDVFRTDGETHKQTGYMFARTWSRYLRLGRLHEIPEPAGKVRVVAMVTWWIQCLLFPLHDWIFKNVLSSISQDGTHDQGKPLEALSEKIVEDLRTTGKSHVYSFDLKAATDRIPSELTVKVLGHLVTPAVAKSWLVLLVGLPYSNKPLRARCHPGEAKIRYGTGMPMGAYSNWAMLALTHHLIVQFAAYRAGYRGWYPLYALLGDDIVILGTAVAKQYKALCESFGIQIGMHKSLISSNGTFEFAKRFYFRGVDASPISIREYWVSLGSLPSFIELIARAKRVRPNLRISDAVRSYSKGYKVVGSLTQRLANLGNTRVANLITALLLPGAPFESTLEAIFSLTATAVKPEGVPVDTPITERRIASTARSLGDAIKQIVGSKAGSAKSFLSRHWDNYILAFKGGRSTRIMSGLMDKGIAPFLAYHRAFAILDRSQDMEILLSVGRYLHSGKLHSRSFINLLGKIIPLWKHSIGDVAAWPEPMALNPVGTVLKRAKLQKILKIRIHMLGLKWFKDHATRVQFLKTNVQTPYKDDDRLGRTVSGVKTDSRRVRNLSLKGSSSVRETIERRLLPRKGTSALFSRKRDELIIRHGVTNSLEQRRKNLHAQ
nr:MAG: putative RNA-dependent RNA polymerase [Mitoviridae sp.]